VQFSGFWRPLKSSRPIFFLLWQHNITNWEEVKTREVPGGRWESLSITLFLRSLTADMGPIIHDNRKMSDSRRVINGILKSKGADAVNWTSSAHAKQQGHRRTAKRRLKKHHATHGGHDLVASLPFSHARTRISGIRCLKQSKWRLGSSGNPQKRCPPYPQRPHSQSQTPPGSTLRPSKQAGQPVTQSFSSTSNQVEVLRVVISIGPKEACTFRKWQPSCNAPAFLTDHQRSYAGISRLTAASFRREDFQTNLIMPEPTVFLSRQLPTCSIVAHQHKRVAAIEGTQVLTDQRTSSWPTRSSLRSGVVWRSAEQQPIARGTRRSEQLR